MVEGHRSDIKPREKFLEQMKITGGEHIEQALFFYQ